MTRQTINLNGLKSLNLGPLQKQHILAIYVPSSDWSIRFSRRVARVSVSCLPTELSDLHTESGLKSLEEHLAGKNYVSGEQFTKDDIKVYAAVLQKPGGEFPNAGKWYETVASHLAASFPGEAVGVRFAGQAAIPAAAPAAEEPKKEVEEDDDDLDLFGDETEEDKKAAEAREAAKASTKKKESGKSSVLLDVKPWDDETDMKKLEEAVRSVEMPGLLWGASKLVPVGYGIKKMTIMMTIEDELVSVDNLIEDHLTAEPRKTSIFRAVTSWHSTKFEIMQMSTRLKSFV